MFEKEQKNRIKKMVEKRFLVANNFTKAQSIRSGMDMLVYDKKNNHLQVIELKYKIPVESEMDITNLDKMLGKAYTQLTLAKKYVGEHEEILEEYFGSEYIGITPKEVDYFVITNYEIFPAYSAFFIIPTPIGYGPVCTPIVAPIWRISISSIPRRSFTRSFNISRNFTASS